MARAAGMGMQGAGGLVGAYGAYQSGKASEAMYKFNEQVDLDNAQQQERLGQIEGDMLLDERRKALSRNMAIYGASGSVMTGSATDVMIETTKTTTLDSLTARYNRRVKATQFRNQALLDKASATLAFKAGQVGAWSSGLGAGSQMAQTYAYSGGR